MKLVGAEIQKTILLEQEPETRYSISYFQVST